MFGDPAIYHWYEGVPIPPVYDTARAVGIDPPIQIVCWAIGWISIVGSGLTITAAVWEVITEQPPVWKVTIQ